MDAYLARDGNVVTEPAQKLDNETLAKLEHSLQAIWDPKALAYEVKQQLPRSLVKSIEYREDDAVLTISVPKDCVAEAEELIHRMYYDLGLYGDEDKGNDYYDGIAEAADDSTPEEIEASIERTREMIGTAGRR